jgi:hypothetical protein
MFYWFKYIYMKGSDNIYFVIDLEHLYNHFPSSVSLDKVDRSNEQIAYYLKRYSKYQLSMLKQYRITSPLDKWKVNIICHFNNLNPAFVQIGSSKIIHIV